jgi:hypothetical protein
MKLILVEIRESKIPGYALLKWNQPGIAIDIPGMTGVTSGGRTIWQAAQLNGASIDTAQIGTEVTVDDSKFEITQSKWTRTDDSGNKSEVTSNWLRQKGI